MHHRRNTTLYWITEVTQHYTESKNKHNTTMNHRRNTTLYWTTEETQRYTERQKKQNAILNLSTQCYIKSQKKKQRYTLP